jgi:hypothetical protein
MVGTAWLYCASNSRFWQYTNRIMRHEYGTCPWQRKKHILFADYETPSYYRTSRRLELEVDMVMQVSSNQLQTLCKGLDVAWFMDHIGTAHMKLRVMITAKQAVDACRMVRK